MTAQLEKLLDGPTVSRSVGQKAINVISNLMEGDSQAISESANRYNSNNIHLHGHIYPHTFDVPKVFCHLSCWQAGSVGR